VSPSDTDEQARHYRCCRVYSGGHPGPCCRCSRTGPQTTASSRCVCQWNHVLGPNPHMFAVWCVSMTPNLHLMRCHPTLYTPALLFSCVRPLRVTLVNTVCWLSNLGRLKPLLTRRSLSVRYAFLPVSCCQSAVAKRQRRLTVGSRLGKGQAKVSWRPKALRQTYPHPPCV
jgi:hypothetical protein